MPSIRQSRRSQSLRLPRSMRTSLPISSSNDPTLAPALVVDEEDRKPQDLLEPPRRTIKNLVQELLDQMVQELGQLETSTSTDSSLTGASSTNSPSDVSSNSLSRSNSGKTRRTSSVMSSPLLDPPQPAIKYEQLQQRPASSTWSSSSAPPETSSYIGTMQAPVCTPSPRRSMTPPPPTSPAPSNHSSMPGLEPMEEDEQQCTTPYSGDSMSERGPSSSSPGSHSSRRTCWSCGQVGHVRNQCRNGWGKKPRPSPYNGWTHPGHHEHEFTLSNRLHCRTCVDPRTTLYTGYAWRDDPTAQAHRELSRFIVAAEARAREDVRKSCEAWRFWRTMVQVDGTTVYKRMDKEIVGEGTQYEVPDIDNRNLDWTRPGTPGTWSQW